MNDRILQDLLNLRKVEVDAALQLLDLDGNPEDPDYNTWSAREWTDQDIFEDTTAGDE